MKNHLLPTPAIQRPPLEAQITYVAFHEEVWFPAPADVGATRRGVLRMVRAHQAGAAPAGAPEPPRRRHQIPRRFLDAASFRYSRQEALYDMHALFGTLIPHNPTLLWWCVVVPLRLLRRLFTAVASTGRMKKWRHLLKRRGLEEQLWTVTPPRRFPHHPTVRRWARETLGRAGYEVERMLVEWEIYWRRRGEA